MKKLSVLRVCVFCATILGLGVLALAGCSGGIPNGEGYLTAPDERVTLVVPSEYAVAVTGAEAPDHVLRVGTPSMSSGHEFEIDIYPTTVSSRGALMVHTAVSPGTEVFDRSNTLYIKVKGTDSASSARYALNTSEGLIEVNAVSGWVLIRFSSDGTVQGYAEIVTEDPRIPTDLRTLTAGFEGALAGTADDAGGDDAGGDDAAGDPPAPPA